MNFRILARARERLRKVPHWLPIQAGRGASPSFCAPWYAQPPVPQSIRIGFLARCLCLSLGDRPTQRAASRAWAGYGYSIVNDNFAILIRILRGLAAGGRLPRDCANSLMSHRQDSASCRKQAQDVRLDVPPPHSTRRQFDQPFTSSVKEAIAGSRRDRRPPELLLRRVRQKPDMLGRIPLPSWQISERGERQATLMSLSQMNVSFGSKATSA
jgi:hypothetical protein